MHIATLVRMRTHDETRSYVQKRTADGKAYREIRRQLKRCLTCKIHRLLTRENTLAVTT